MATTLSKPITRKTVMQDDFGRTGWVVVELNALGIWYRGHGKSRKFFVPHSRAVKQARLPGNMPARHAANPIGWLLE